VQLDDVPVGEDVPGSDLLHDAQVLEKPRACFTKPLPRAR
jgi:hypothetical protein